MVDERSVLKWLLMLGPLVAFLGCSSTAYQAKEEVYLFSYFTGNGEDGLHLAYSLDGYQFKELEQGVSVLTPTAGSDKLMRDPCIIRDKNGRFHMVWTVSWNEKGLGYAYSDDLVNWSEQEYLPVMEHEPAARNTWAPEVFYDKEEDRFIIYWSSTIRGLYPETQSQEEDGYNHRQYYVTTKDFKEFSDTKLFYEPGFNVIDGTIQKIGDEYLLFVKDETREPPRKNIRIARAQKPEGPYAAAGSPITGNYWAEGPTVSKVGDYWVVYFDKYIEKKMGAVMSSDLQNWTDISDRISFPRDSRHGTVFKVEKLFFDNLPFER